VREAGNEAALLLAALSGVRHEREMARRRGGGCLGACAVITVVERCTKNGWYWYVLNQSGEILAAKASARTAFELAAIAQEVLTHQEWARQECPFTGPYYAGETSHER
jgi:hypothetical protein